MSARKRDKIFPQKDSVSGLKNAVKVLGASYSLRSWRVLLLLFVCFLFFPVRNVRNSAARLNSRFSSLFIPERGERAI